MPKPVGTGVNQPWINGQSCQPSQTHIPSSTTFQPECYTIGVIASVGCRSPTTPSEASWALAITLPSWALRLHCSVCFFLQSPMLIYGATEIIARKDSDGAEGSQLCLQTYRALESVQHVPGVAILVWGLREYVALFEGRKICFGLICNMFMVNRRLQFSFEWTTQFIRSTSAASALSLS